MQIAPVAAAAFSLQGYARPELITAVRATTRRPVVTADKSVIRRGYTIDIIC